LNDLVGAFVWGVEEKASPEVAEFKSVGVPVDLGNGLGRSCSGWFGDGDRAALAVHAEIGDAVWPGFDSTPGCAGNEGEVIGVELVGGTVDGDFAGAGLDEHQHVDFVVDVLADRGVGVEADQVGVEVAAVGQTPDDSNRAGDV